MLNPENKEYTVTHDNEIAYILSRFDDDFIYNTIDESIKSIFQLSVYRSLPNIPAGYETNFKLYLTDYPDARNEILLKRNETYEHIIRILCDRYQLIYDDHDTYSIATSAVYMYDLLVSSFLNTAKNFFVNFIIKEKTGLYKSLALDDQKKNKDISTVYAKKTFEDSELGAISANIETVIKNICEMDISFDTYLDLGFQSYPNIANFFKEILEPSVDFFKTFIKPIVYGDNAISFITEVRLALLNIGDIGFVSNKMILSDFKTLEEDN